MSALCIICGKPCLIALCGDECRGVYGARVRAANPFPARAEIIEWLQEVHARAIYEAGIVAEALAFLGAPLSEAASSSISAGGARREGADSEIGAPSGGAPDEAVLCAFQAENEGRAERGLRGLALVEFLPIYRDRLAGVARPDGITQDSDGPETAVRP